MILFLLYHESRIFIKENIQVCPMQKHGLGFFELNHNSFLYVSGKEALDINLSVPVLFL